MKFAWIFWVLFAISDGVPTNLNGRHSSSSTEDINTSRKIKGDDTQSLNNASRETGIINRLMPEIQMKEIVPKDNHSTFISTTRRPLMKNLKFTSKPHAVHYIPSRTQGEESNFSKRRNLSNNNQFKIKNKNKNTANSAENLSSVEDRFKNFKDIDDVRKATEGKRKISTNRQLNRRRGYPLAAAASEQIKSVSIYTLLNTDKYRSKSKSAIQESLQKIKTIRPGMKQKAITTKNTTAKVKNNIESSATKNSEDNKSISGMASIYLQQTKLLQFTTTSDTAVYLPITTAKSILFVTTPKNIHDSQNESIGADKSALTSLKLHNGLTTPKASVNTTVIAEKEESSTKTESSGDLAGTANLDYSATNIEKAGNVTVLVGQHKELNTNIAEMDDSINKQEEQLANRASKLKNLKKSDSENLQSTPIIIVTGKSIFLPSTSNALETITSENSVISEEKVNSEVIHEIEERIITVTPVPKEEKIFTTESTGNHSAQTLRHKRRVNIIEEESAATTSTGFRYFEREAHLDADLTYRNIHA